MTGQTIELAGSYRAAPPGATNVGEVDPDERIVLTVYLKRRTPDTFEPGCAEDLARLSKPVTRRALAAQRRRTHARAAARIKKLAAQFHVTVLEIDLSRRIVVLEATARTLTEVLGATLRIYDDGRSRFRARVGSLVVPKEIAPWTRAILGFDQRPVSRPQPRLRALAGAGAGAGLWPTEVAALYGIPLDRDVSKVCVGIIALGGGYLASDLAQALAAAGRAAPRVIDQPVTIGVPPGGNAAPGNQFGGGTVSDQEIALDLQILASLLPGARIVVYFAGNTIQSLVGAINQAIFDAVNRPQVLSVSWGSAEMFWSASARDAMQGVLADAKRLNVTVLFAAGDELATGGLTDGNAHVWFPASSPYALSCGGTQPATAALNEEVVWNEGGTGTGGGISDVFPVPAYQSGLALPPSVNDGAVRRGVPDVAGAAAGTPGYRIVLNGSVMIKDGTSAVAPLWAGLIAIANAGRDLPIGFVNSALYSNAALFRQIEHGNNRVDGKGYDAGRGWNACTGLGVPKGADLVAALGAIPVA
ncbi:S8 family serine peptidase [Bradyrhizobium sp. Arg68]|uniref:S53 family peptidase n=1 Tax=Bradyrhizobium ivorense TaxID=2511166 RepID=UPI0027E28D4A|nr:S53 family peptidase [Bradyrhizobium ivorense]MCC8942566.1 S8 family serine peptidase [Bradyrhizobium ivorense]